MKRFAGSLGLFVVCTFLFAACAERTGDGGGSMDTTATTADTMGMMQESSNMGGSGFQANYRDLDQNTDQKVTEDEFTSGLQNQQLYDNWDANGNAEITEDEFGNGLFSTWNENGDQYLTEDEFNNGADVWFDDDYDYSYGDWDADGNDQLSQQEFNDGVMGLGIFDGWDADGDGNISEDEYYGGLYDTWDANADGNLTEQEFNDASSIWYANDNSGGMGNSNMGDHESM